MILFLLGGCTPPTHGIWNQDMITGKTGTPVLIPEITQLYPQFIQELDKIETGRFNIPKPQKVT